MTDCDTPVKATARTLIDSCLAEPRFACFEKTVSTTQDRLSPAVSAQS